MYVVTVIKLELLHLHVWFSLWSLMFELCSLIVSGILVMVSLHFCLGLCNQLRLVLSCLPLYMLYCIAGVWVCCIAISAWFRLHIMLNWFIFVAFVYCLGYFALPQKYCCSDYLLQCSCWLSTYTSWRGSAHVYECTRVYCSHLCTICP